MRNILIFGGSGSLGIEFIRYIVNSSTYQKIIVFTSSTAGQLKLAPYVDSGEISIFTNFDDNIDTSAPYDVVNFAFLASGAPWTRPFKNRDLCNKIHDFCRKLGVVNFIEISTQSVFGYNFKADVDYTSTPPRLLSEYGLTKLEGEKAAIANSSAYEKLSIVRLGNVLFEGSAPFNKRIHDSLMNSRIYDLNGYSNITLLPNVLSALLYILNSEFPRKGQEIYHFSEFSFVRWSDVHEKVSRSYPGNIFTVRSNNRHLSKGLKSLAKNIFRSRIFWLVLKLNLFFKLEFNFLLRFYIKNRKTTFYVASDFDLDTYDVFRSRNRFLPRFPHGYRYAWNQTEFDKFLAQDIVWKAPR